MKKNGRKTTGISAVAWLCAGTMVLTGCSAKESEEGRSPFKEMGQSTEDDAFVPAEELAATEKSGNSVEESMDTGAEPETEENSGGSGQELWKEQVRHYYGGVLSQIIAARQLPDGELDTSSLDAGFGEMRDNHFAITDIDGDGMEELIVSYSNATMAGMVEIVYGFDPEAGQLEREFTAFPAIAYYDNGIIKAEASHNHTRGDVWPFALYQYQADSDTYVQIGYVDTWSKDISGEWPDGQAFPDELDSDGDGVLYNIQEGAGASYEFSDYKYNVADYETWYQSLMEGANEITIDYQPMEYESFADLTPAYLKRIADEAGKNRTDTEADLGLLILEEDLFPDAAESLLSERYGVEIQQPYEDFDEAQVGLWNGQEIFSFEHLNAGLLDYHKEKVEDVTIFGLYPGISADSAWEKLTAYGFYASPYGETDNCLITGDGFGNISIWFSEEEGKVTQISVRPFCAFAG